MARYTGGEARSFAGKQIQLINEALYGINEELHRFELDDSHEALQFKDLLMTQRTHLLNIKADFEAASFLD
jgi:hypothetical protein